MVPQEMTWSTLASTYPKNIWRIPWYWSSGSNVENMLINH
jgi:hypothetical protein